MFKFLKDTWRDARKQVEDEDRARAAKSMFADMGGVARRFADDLARTGLTLDYTVASFAAVDRLLAGTKKQLATRPPAEREKLENIAALNIGAYVGEVLVREPGGVWSIGTDGLPVVDLGGHIVPVVELVLALFEGKRIPPGTRLADLLVAHYDASRAPGLQQAMSDDPELAGWLFNQAAQAVKTASVKWNVALDFSPKSLDAVEQILGRLHDLLKTAPENDRPTEKQIETLALAWGIYVGEVMRRHYGGKWSIAEPESVLQLEINGARVFPARKVQKRLLDGPGDAIPFYFKAIPTALAYK